MGYLATLDESRQKTLWEIILKYAKNVEDVAKEVWALCDLHLPDQKKLVPEISKMTSHAKLTTGILPDLAKFVKEGEPAKTETTTPKPTRTRTPRARTEAAPKPVFELSTFKGDPCTNRNAAKALGIESWDPKSRGGRVFVYMRDNPGFTLDAMIALAKQEGSPLSGLQEGDIKAKIGFYRRRTLGKDPATLTDGYQLIESDGKMSLVPTPKIAQYTSPAVG